jgi:ribosomal protein S12 methylthiotransferase accessory factor
MNTSAVTGPLASFAWGSNGLASSVDRQEAILSGLYEVIERDSLACWSNYIQKNLSTKLFCVDVTSLPFTSSRRLISKITEAGLELYLVQLRNELHLPVFKCHILNNIDQARSTASGYGCHHSAEIAINRAITEAVQGRTCFISGSREDILTKRFNSTDYGYAKSHFSNFIQEEFVCDVSHVSSTVDALASLINSFDALGWHRPIVFDYPNSGPFSVVKVICPSLMPVSFSGMSMFHPRLSTFTPPRTKFQLFCESIS